MAKKTAFKFRAVVLAELERQGISENELTRRAKLSQGALCKVLNKERDESNVRVGTLLAICEALSIPLTRFFT